MVAALMHDTDQISQVRKAVCKSLHKDGISAIATAVGEVIKNGMHGSHAFVVVIPLVHNHLLLVINDTINPRLVEAVNGEISQMAAHTVKETHGFGTEIIQNVFGNHYFLIKAGLIAFSGVMITDDMLKL